MTWPRGHTCTGFDDEYDKHFTAMSNPDAELNEAEYSGPFLAALLYLSAKGVECSYGGVIALLGQVVYTWSRIFGLPIFPIGALTRYIALPMLITSIYKTLD